MKLWYQSMSRDDEPTPYHKVITNILDQIKDDGTTIEIHGINRFGGGTNQYRYLEHISTNEVLENLQIAMRSGFDAFLLGNILDPGLHACREISNIPVLALCETSLHLACMMGANYSLVSVNEKYTPRVLENVARYGLEKQLVAVRRMTIRRGADLNAAFTNKKVCDAVVGQFLEAAAATIDEGAEVVIPAGGGVMTLLAHAGVHTAGRGTPILNAITALVKMGEMAVKLNGIMAGNFTSKRLTYAPPGSDQIDEIRKYYGDVYPTVESKSRSTK